MFEFSETQPVSLRLRGLTLICRKRSAHHDIRLFRHAQLGRVLVIDGEIQHVEAFAPFYHEPLVHLPAAFIPCVDRVLILGGGSLYAAQEALRYPSAKITLVDHDRVVLDLICANYPHGKAIVTDPRFEYVEGDATAFVAETSCRYDLVVNDCFDLSTVGPDMGMYRALYRLLSPDGVCSDLVYRPVAEKAHTVAAMRHLSRQRLRRAYSLVVVPEYPGILHLLMLWGRNRWLSQRQRVSRNAEQSDWAVRRNPCQLFSPSHLGFHLYLPPYLRNALGLAKKLTLEG